MLADVLPTAPDAQAVSASAIQSRGRDALGLGASYFFFALLAIHLSRQPGSIAAVWFANAIGVACLANRPTRQWPELLGVVAAANLLANLAYGDAFSLAASFLPANTLEVLIGGWMLRRMHGAAHFSASAGGFMRVLAAGAIGAPLIGATLGAWAIHLHGFARFGPTWVDWYIGSSLGAIAMLPFALEALRQGGRDARSQLLTWPAAAFALATLGVAAFSLTSLRFPFVYMALPLIGAALVLPLLPTLALALLVALSTSVALAFGYSTSTLAAAEWKQALNDFAVVAALLPAQLLAVVVARQLAASRTLAALTSAATEPASFVDNQLVYRVVNRAHARYFAKSRDAVIGRTMAEMIPKQTYDEFVAPNMRKALAGQIATYRAAIEYRGVGLRTLDVSYEPAYDEHQRQIGVLIHAHDVTDLVATQTELERSLVGLRASNESLEQFVRIASHDLREPLNTMVQFSALIRDDHGDELPPAARLYLEHLCDGSLRMRTLLDDVLAFVRLDAAQQPALASVALDDVLAQSLEALNAMTTARHARIDVAPLPAALGHAGLLTLLFQNLVSNAVKFVPAGRTPHVVVTATSDADGVIVSVADNGIGIAPEHVPQLFAPFKRLHSRRKFEGTGLGLAICKRIAQAHSGEISIASTPGVGSCFNVRLQHPA